MNSNVSIVIPTFNRADLLSRAIETSLSQTYQCEVIVVDHGSTDHTPDIAKKFNREIKYIRRETDFGPHFCWLEGVLRSSGDFVHLQFDDDWIQETFIEACMNVMDDETGFSFSRAEVEFDDKQNNTVLFKKMPKVSGIYSVSKLEKRILKAQVISPGCCVFRRQLLIDSIYIGNLPLDKHSYHGVGPDRFMTLLPMLHYPKVGFVSEPLAIFYAHAGSITIDALSDKQKKKELGLGYKNVIRYYKELKALLKFRRFSGYYVGR
ncbi:MAG: glycosyltransferase family 2 protein [Ekhidna sp.]|nr:glycosyltransferase family 2 protein [Ekhidna sp.]